MDHEELQEIPPQPSEFLPPIDLESDIDLSTLRFITGTLRHTFLPYLGWIIAFTSFAKLTRFFSPFLFRFTRWSADWGFWMLEKLVKFLAWSCMWLGMLAAGVWLMGGALLIVLYLWIRLKPRLRKSMQERPNTTRLASKAVIYLVPWYLMKLIAGKWVGRVVAVVIIGWETHNHFFRGPRTTNSATPPPVRRTSRVSDKEEEEQLKEDEEQAELWARKVRNEMLKESLLKKGRTTGNGTEQVEHPETDIHEID